VHLIKGKILALHHSVNGISHEHEFVRLQAEIMSVFSYV